jgi:membrane-bound metal-dependent hydrolase YbcI (DUF457 family)
MPFTPFHMGPGIAIKAILGSSFSLMIFGWTQIVMDVQPLIAMISGEGKLHGFTHTYIGATLIALFSAISGKQLSEFGLRLFAVPVQNSGKIFWWVSFLSAFIGSFSHVLLDSIMHGDVEPFYPFNQSNGLHNFISVAALHKLCLYSGLVGAIIYCLIALRQGKE